jgi:uncharacterized damage-inducible protein DinB
MAEDIRYPVGKWIREPQVDAAACRRFIDELAVAPAHLSAATKGLSDTQLDTPYRDGGWTPRQIVHHVADSHMNAYTRFKLGVTEDNPTIKPYNEKLWAETVDSRTAPLSLSLPLIDALHDRWVRFLRSLDDQALARTINHPERGPMTLTDLLQLYAWHGRHHTAHITGLRQRMGW